MEVYFDTSRHAGVSKEEVAEFIVGQMGLERSNGGPKWTEGITTLIKLGMESWRSDPVNNRSELKESIYKLERKIDKYHKEVKDSDSEQAKTESADELVHAADLVHRTEARILEVLCRDENIGAKSPDYVDIQSLVEETGLKYPTVYQYVDNLRKLPSGELIQFDVSYEQVKVTSEDGFTEYCQARGIDLEKINAENEPE